MADQFVGEIRMFGCNFAPFGWALCNGQIMPISQNTALFSLLGTFYGGDGKSNFALPNLQGNFPMNMGQGPGLTPRDIGETGGEAAVTLLQTQMPGHAHAAQCLTGGGSSDSPVGNEWAMAHVSKAHINAYTAYTANNPNTTAMNAAALAAAGGNQPHNNLPPYLVINFCIAMQGFYPSRQ